MAGQEKNKRTLMLDTPLKKLIPMMAFPTIIAQLVSTVYNLVDTYFVSSLGTFATAAVGVNSSLERTILLFGSLIASGASSYISRLLGAEKKENADRVFNTSFFTALGIGILILTGGTIFLKPMVYLLGATEDCVEFSMQYAQYVLLVAPFMISSFILQMCLRSEGSATLSMIGIGFGAVLNCFLDPLFIFTFDLGVKGASMATAISKFVSFCILLWPYLRKKTVAVLSIRYFRYVFEEVKEVLVIGSIFFFRSLLQVIAMVSINRIAGSFSTSALAAMSVSSRIMGFPFAIVLGFSQGYQPVVGFNWGAKRFDRVKESLTFSLTVSVVGGIVMGALLFIFTVPIIQLFNSAADAEVLRLGQLSVRLESAMLLAHCAESVIILFYGGIGYAKHAFIMNTGRQGYMLYPLLLILPCVFGVEGLAACQAGADFLMLFVCLPMAIRAYRITQKAEREEFLNIQQPDQGSSVTIKDPGGV